MGELLSDISDVITGFGPQNANDVQFAYQFDVDRMLTVKSYVHSIFLNLISNSIKYRKKGQPLIVEVYSKGTSENFDLVFKDNGVGIDLEKKAGQIFGMYKRFHPDLAEGKGMGLFMVKAHVEKIGGRISVKSQQEVGTEFTI